MRQLQGRFQTPWHCERMALLCSASRCFEAEQGTCEPCSIRWRQCLPGKAALHDANVGDRHRRRPEGNGHKRSRRQSTCSLRVQQARVLLHRGLG